MMTSVPEATQGPRARTTGAVYLLYFLTAVFAQFIAGRTTVVFSDAAALVSTACYVALTLLLYALLKPVSGRLSVAAASSSLVGCVVQVLSLFRLAPVHAQLLFFGIYCLLLGYLIFRSTFLPWILGLLLAAAGLGWLLFLTPIAGYLATEIEVVGVVAEAAFMLWLLAFGVDTQRWNEQRRASDGVTAGR